ncbi:MAG: 50S ribosomal protein L15e [Candidatus Nanohaloarchaeota archaeon QJJ-9]|nr:50S ribosomal protein L15e [Candidatus Nanohaloarchaeota archaeon QJJ-9]
MTFYKHARKAWRNPSDKMEKIWRQRLKDWRKQPAIERIENPTRIAKARSLGYKAKPGFVLVRGRIRRGGRKRAKIKAGRKPKKSGRTRYTPKENLMQIMEERVSDKHPNLEVLASYPVAKDGIYKWFEHVLVDPDHPSIKNDDSVASAAEKSGRAERGLTNAGKKSRGLENRGKGAEKVRPSVSSSDGKSK